MRQSLPVCREVSEPAQIAIAQLLHFQRAAKITFARRESNSWRPACKKKSVRIAIPRSTNPSSTSPLLKESERAGASFRDVLASSAGESAQAAKSPVEAKSVLAPKSESESEVANEAVPARAIVKIQADQRNENWQPVAPSSSQKPVAAQAPSLPTARSNTAWTNISTNRDERPQMSATALAAKIAATVTLPTAQPAPAAISAISVPTAPRLAEEKTVGDGRDSSEDASGKSSIAIGNHVATAAQCESRIPDKPQQQAAKTADGTAEGGTETISESQESTPSASTGIARSTVAVNECGDASQLGNLILSGISLVPSAADANLPTSKETPGKTSDPSAGTAADASAAGGAGKSNQASSASPSTDLPARSIPNNDQTPQHAQSDASQAALAASKSSDGTALQVQVIGTQPTTHEAAAGHIRTDSPAEATRPSSLPAEAQNADATTTSGINTARLIESMGETEMHVGMRSAEFGDISIRTAVSQQQVMAQISVDHSDLGKAISAHIPAMQEKLGGELGVRATVEVSQSGMSFSGERGYSSQQQAKASSFRAVDEGNRPSAEAEHSVLRTTTLEAGNSYRLDIRA